MLESWLLADEDAIREVLGHRAKVKPVPNPENIRNPWEKLEKIFRSAGKEFRYTVDDAKIAQAVKDVRRFKKCPTFAKFYEAVLGP